MVGHNQLLPFIENYELFRSTLNNLESNYTMLTELVHEYEFARLFTKVDPAPGIQSFLEFYREKKEAQSQIPVRFLPNVGISVRFNLGTPVVLKFDKESMVIHDHFLMPTNRTWIEEGRYFEVKFKFGIMPFFPGYRNLHQLPMNAHELFCPLFVKEIEQATSFEERVIISNHYFSSVYEKHKSSTEKYRIIEKMVRQFHEHNDGNFRIMEGLKNNFVSSKSLQRYFLKNFGITPKAVFCILRMRKALESYFDESQSFRVYDYDYYDYSHFYKEIKKLIGLNLPQLKQHRNVYMNQVLPDKYLKF